MQIGDEAPDFTLDDQHGRAFTLSELRGRAAAIVVFYPFAFSPVCTQELTALRDHPALARGEVELVAVSCDSMYVLRHFSDTLGLTHRLLSDFWPHGEVARRYGVLDPTHGCATRATYVVDREGRLRWSIENALPDARDHDEVLAVLDRLKS